MFFAQTSPEQRRAVMSVVGDKEYLSHCDTYYLKPGFIYVTQKPAVIATVLGFCDTGGLLGRKVLYITEFNELSVRKLKKIGSTDYYTNAENK